MHTLLSHPNPVSEESLVWRAYQGVKRLQGEDGQPKQRLPITVELLLQLERWQDVESLDGQLTRAAMWLGTCGLLRSGEFTVRNKNSAVVLRNHLTFHNDYDSTLLLPSALAAYMSLRLTRTKTEQYGSGTVILVSHPKAISAILLSASHSRPDSPLLRTASMHALSHSFLMQRVRALLLSAGVDNIDRYKGHSFRRGGATSLHLAGQPDSVIKAMGRWRSFTFATYVDTPPAVLLQAGRSMANSSAHGKSVTFAARQFEDWDLPVWGKD